MCSTSGNKSDILLISLKKILCRLFMQASLIVKVFLGKIPLQQMEKFAATCTHKAWSTDRCNDTAKTRRPGYSFYKGSDPQVLHITFPTTANHSNTSQFFIEISRTQNWTNTSTSGLLNAITRLWRLCFSVNIIFVADDDFAHKFPSVLVRLCWLL